MNTNLDTDTSTKEIAEGASEQIDETSERFSKFLALANIALGSLVGLLITLPVVAASQSAGSSFLLLGGALLGGITGKRNGSSRGFLYFAIFCVLALSSLITTSTGKS